MAIASGRPRVYINLDDVEFLRSLRFTWEKISDMIGVSRSTLYRRLDEEGIGQTITYTDINDGNLDHLIREIKLQHPYDGERLMAGHLARYGVRVTRARLRSSIHRVDPINTVIRRSVTIRRRSYHTSGPNAVWHIDGNHKMIQWHFVIHGGVDGFSRTIVFLSCSDNNKGDTVLQLFPRAIESYGLPNKIRTHQGGENTDIWRYMIEEHSSSEAVITGSSVHNERIEHLWRDVSRSVNSIFINSLRTLEERNQLNPLNLVDIFCLHWVYLPKINQILTEFSESWNNHPISTEHNQTPNQLFCQGMLFQMYQLHSSLLTPSSMLHIPTANDTVEIPSEKFNPCIALKITLNALTSTTINNDEMTNYLEISNVVGQHLQHSCDSCI